jgi:acetyl-CoA C-acetyltransferase
MMKDIYIHGARRTPIGLFQGALASIPAPRLGAMVIKAALEAGRFEPEEIDEVEMGNILSAGLGQAPARQAARFAGLPDKVPAVTVNKVCGSGMQTVIAGARAILCGEMKTVVAGGMESMSRVPYLLPEARCGQRMGHGTLLDGMIHDGLWDPYHDKHMGSFGEACAREYGFTREAQDAFATESYLRAQSAVEREEFRQEITPVTIRGRHGNPVLVDTDEGPARANFDKMRTLPPAFEMEGTITAANASKIADGAAAVILSTRMEGAMAHVVAWGGHAQAPEKYTTAPVAAIRNALLRADWNVDDVDLWEVNEAFAVVPMVVMKELGVSRDKFNVRGGSIALGHPIGASGARILVTLLHAMRDRDAKRGVAAICLGGGEALAMCVER